MLGGIAASAASANAYDAEINGIFYDLSRGEATVTHNGEGYGSYHGWYYEIPSYVEYEGDGYIVTGIGDYTFCGCWEVGEVYLPSTIQYIGESAFEDVQLYNINLPYEIREIGARAFRNCQRLSYVELPGNLRSVGDDAFANCYELAGVMQIPTFLGYIGSGAFSHTQIVAFEVSPGNDTFTNTTDGFLLSHNGTCIEVVPPAYSADSYTVPSSITEIASGAFSGVNINSIVVPDNVISIGNSAFSGCSMSSIQLPSTLKAIGQYMLSQCHNLNNLVIPEGVESIYQYAISWCASLENVIFPKSLRRIEWTGFYRTDGLKHLVLPDGLEYLGPSSFAQCENLVDAYIPASVCDIPYSPFNGCKSMTNITVSEDNAWYKDIDGNLYTKDGRKFIQIIPTLGSYTVAEGTDDIMEMAAWGCQELAEVTLPSTLEVVRDLAFAFCPALNTVNCLATTPPRWSSDRCFNGVANREDCTLYVPFGCKEAYENDKNWSCFVNIEEKDFETGVGSMSDAGGNVSIKYAGGIAHFGKVCGYTVTSVSGQTLRSGRAASADLSGLQGVVIIKAGGSVAKVVL